MLAITTHQNADFDALASMVAAGKLYPGAQLVLPGSLNSNVREFVSLYKDALHLRQQKETDLSGLNALVVTDTRQKNRIGVFEKYLDSLSEIHVYDHHPETDDDITADKLVYEEIGATTTLLLEEIFAREIPLTTVEATLFALGIYEDTGSLTFETTTFRDVNALCRLWKTGVNLKVVNEFLNQPLEPEQRRLLDDLLAATEYHELRGVRVALATAEADAYVPGLSLLTHKLMEMEDVDMFFTAVSMEGRLYIVGRSRLENPDLAQVLAPFGGKGHRRAASAIVKQATADEVRDSLVGTLYKEVYPVKTARDIMSSPVRTVPSDTTVEKARELMLRYGHSGFPVLENGTLLGIISRRDLEKASHHGLGHAPVKGYMNKKPITIPPDLPVRKIQRIMVDYNVGRLPVTDGDGIAGIVTRTDVLRNLEGAEKIACYSGNRCLPAAGDDLTPLLTERLPRELQSLLLLVGQVADRENVRAYAVGGFIRDLLLDSPNQDLDLVVEPEAIPFAAKLNALLGGQLRTHEQFGTATIFLRDGGQIDLVTSRQEFYAHPAALPEVEQSNLRNDLFRRDFTINTLACSLNAPHFGRLFDFFQGIQDLADGVIRVLYNLSLVEDPLRVLRAVRFEQRFGFRIEETTLSLIENAVQTRVLDKVTKERLHDELILALKEERAPEILLRYFSLGIAAQLFPGIRLTEKLKKRLPAARDMLSWADRNWPDAHPNPAALYLTVVMQDIPFQEARHLCRNLRLQREERDRVMQALEALPELKKQLLAEKNQRPSEINRLFAGQPVETLLALQADSDESRVWAGASLYWEKLRNTETEMGGYDLLALGYPAGPRFNEVLCAVRDARLDGEVKTKEEELALAKKLFS